MKKCPFCAEEIQNEAIKCKHCGEMLSKTTHMLNYRFKYSRVGNYYWEEIRAKNDKEAYGKMAKLLNLKYPNADISNFEVVIDSVSKGNLLCPKCGVENNEGALRCKNNECLEILPQDSGETLGEEILRKVREKGVGQKQEQYGVPALLSLILPGLGQMVKGQVGKGVGLLICTIIGYAMLILPGVALHIYTIYDAYNSPKE